MPRDRFRIRRSIEPENRNVLEAITGTEFIASRLLDTVLGHAGLTVPAMSYDVTGDRRDRTLTSEGHGHDLVGI